MSVLLVEKINHRFKRATRGNQSSGLSVCLGMIAESVDAVSRVTVDNFEHIMFAIQRFKPKKVVIQALWLSEKELIKLISTYPNKQFYVHLHSNIPFLAVEGYAVEKIHEARRHGVGVIFNDARAADAFDGIHLPNIYNVPFREVKSQNLDKEVLDVVCAGSLRPMKNQVTQAIAAIKYANKIGKKLRLHMNLERSEGGNETLMNLKSLFRMNLQHELVSIPWFEHKQFIDYLEQMDIGLQVSLSESFNIVAADYTCAGIPMVVSSEISWASDRAMAMEGSADLICETIETAHNYVHSNRVLLQLNSNYAKDLWSEFAKT